MPHMQSFITGAVQPYQETASLNNALQKENKAKEKPAASIFTVHTSNFLPIHFPTWNEKIT